MIRKLKNTVHWFEALAANLKYGFPSRSLKVIGVTGTDGKTTTSHLLYHILKSAGKSVSLTSSVYADIAGDISDTGLHVTTQSRWDIQKNMRKAAEKGCEYFVIETTSHGIDQYRVGWVRFAYSILTNVTNEHLDYHKTYENYLKTKVKLLLWAEKAAIVNKDDESFQEVAKILLANKKEFVTFSLHDTEANYVWSDKIKTTFQEDFNRENIMAALACCREIGLSQSEILKGIRTFTLPKGRLDCVYDQDFRVFIDFAHTPNSIRKLLKELKSSKGRIIHVFGSAGLRDAEKRPDMGRASGESADIVIVTEEDYRTERFSSITKAIIKGLNEHGFTKAKNKTPEKKEYVIKERRQEAISFAISLAKKGDVVVLTGKGHEQSLARGKKEYSWDEYRAVRKALILKQ